VLKKKELPAFKVGSDWRFNLESIDKWSGDAERGCGSIGAEPAKTADADRKRLASPAISRGM
jgi:hypothetical protein